MHKQLLSTLENQYHFLDLPAFLCSRAFNKYYAVNYIIAAFITVFLVSLFIVNLDITISAKGKIVPSENIKTIQSFQAGKIKATFVKEGDFVKAGDTLVEIDPIEEDLSLSKFQEKLSEKTQHVNLLRSFLQKKEKSDTLKDFVFELKQKAQDMLIQLVIEKIQTYISALEGWDSKIKTKDEEVSYLKQKVFDLKKITAHKKEKINGYFELFQKGFVSKVMYHTAQEEFTTAQHHEHDAANALKHTLQDLENLKKERELFCINNSEALQRTILELDDQVRDAKDAHAKFTIAKNNRYLKAPVDGVVDKLFATTLGEVVTSSQQVAIITPTSGGLEVECYIESKDIGFVKNNQNTLIKIDTYPYSIYGTIEGKIVNVSQNSFQVGQELLYKIKVIFNETNCNNLKFSPGMTLECNVITGQRKAIYYFIAPIHAMFNQALKER
jgi:hemolysin D